MSLAWERYEGKLAVRMETHYARAWLVPAVGLTSDEAMLQQQFAAYLEKRQTQGYAQEDAATLALVELAAAQRSSTLTDPNCFPRLIDIDLAPNAQRHRLGGAAFAPMKDPHAGIYPIVDSLAMLETLLAAGVRIIQLRIKSDKLTPGIERTIAQAVVMARSHPKAQLFINDYWQVAIAHGAYGVHLGQEDLMVADLQAIHAAGLRLGVSSHAYWEVARALTIAPSYIACGPIFPTRAKVMPWVAQGIGNLAYWTALIPHPVIAIGGINAENLDQVRATGCACASVIAAIASDPDPAAAYQRLQRRWHAGPAGKTTGLATQGITRIASPTLTPTKES